MIKVLESLLLYIHKYLPPTILKHYHTTAVRRRFLSCLRMRKDTTTTIIQHEILYAAVWKRTVAYRCRCPGYRYACTSISIYSYMHTAVVRDVLQWMPGSYRGSERWLQSSQIYRRVQNPAAHQPYISTTTAATGYYHMVPHRDLFDSMNNRVATAAGLVGWCKMRYGRQHMTHTSHKRHTINRT